MASCPYCGEMVEVDVEPLGVPEERFVQDCDVCCRPCEVRVVREEDDVQVFLAREDA